MDDMQDFGVPRRPQTEAQLANRFKKGNKASAGPRRTDKQLFKIQEPVMAKIFREAKGDAYMIQKLMLTRGEELKLDVKTTIYICDKINPYEKARAKDDVKDLAPAFNIVENRVDTKTAHKASKQSTRENEI